MNHYESQADIDIDKVDEPTQEEQDQFKLANDEEGEK